MDSDYLNIPGIPGSGAAASLPGSEGTQPSLPGSKPARSRRRQLLWLELVAAVVFATFLGLMSIGFLGTALASHQARGTTRVGQLIGVLVCVGLLYLATRWVIRVEHRLRRHQPIALAFAAGSPTAGVSGPVRAVSGPVPARGATGAGAGIAVSRGRARTHSSRTSTRRRRHYGPVGTSVIAAIFGAITLGLIAGAVSTHSQGVRSGFVQSHGILSTAMVDSVDNTQQCSRSGCSYTSAIAVTLPAPVRGVASTVVHYPDYSDLSFGETVGVLVDPRQPGYAELPGAKFVNAGDWIILAVMAALAALATVNEIRQARRLFAYRRAHLAGSTAPLA